MDIRRWQVGVAATLSGLTLVFYAIRWFLFPGAALHEEMWRFLVGDIAFLFLQVLVVTMLIDSALQKRHRQEMNRKLNMVIGAFFSQAGTRLLGELASADSMLAEVRDDLVPRQSWKQLDFNRATAAFKAHDAKISLGEGQLAAIRDALSGQKGFMLNLLANQSLLEHETFADLLWALTHLAEELEVRSDLEHLSTPDRIHLEHDVKRAYGMLGSQWIGYLGHLQTSYPYLFSLALRTNPLDPGAQVEVTS